MSIFFFQAEDGIRDFHVTGVQTCALPISATLLAMLRRAAAIQEEAGHTVRLKCSDALRDAAHEEARTQGLSFEAFEQQLDRRLRSEERRVGKEWRDRVSQPRSTDNVDEAL